MSNQQMSIAYRSPGATDAAPIWRLAQERTAGKSDSCYGFLLWCTHFADTSVVAASADDVVGYALAYRLPLRPQEAFVCQLGIAPAFDRIELTLRLLEELLSRRACRDARFLSMTCDPRDSALVTAFQQLARRRSVRCAVEPCFPASLFAEPHPDEHLLRVGPFEF